LTCDPRPRSPRGPYRVIQRAHRRPTGPSLPKYLKSQVSPRPKSNRFLLRYRVSSRVNTRWADQGTFRLGFTSARRSATPADVAKSEDSGGRRAQAKAVARELVDVLENETVAIDRCLMKAQRLARILRDSYAQTWLDHETRGYPADIQLAKALGPCAKYAFRWVASTNSVITVSLPALEAQMKAAEVLLSRLQGPTVTTTAANYLESGATTAVINAVQAQMTKARDAYSSAAAEFSRMKSHLYRYAADTLVSLEFGDVAEDIFQGARNRADEFVRTNAPKAAEQLLAAEERMKDGSAESLSAALTSCRRVLCTIADAVFPASDQPYLDKGGKSRKVGSEQYLNRLLAYVETKTGSSSTRSILESQVEHLAARLEAVYEKACKGVHDDVTEDEARLVLIQTYLFIAEVARLGK
jgi:hypothetical protein